MACGNQRTVGSPASLAGTSLHTGQPVTLTLKPAPADFGIKFRRVDIPDQPFINADVEKVQTVERATSLAEGSVKVHTVEHILSALTGMGIDNAVIEMDANEPPIGFLRSLRGTDQERRHCGTGSAAALSGSARGRHH